MGRTAKSPARRGAEHYPEDNEMPYMWPRGHVEGPRTAQHAWMFASVVLLAVLIAAIVMMVIHRW